MSEINAIEWEILNATADDWEDLGQIHRLVASAADHRPELAAVAGAVRRLVEAGLLEPRQADGGRPDVTDPRYVETAWFAMTPMGRQVWESAAAAKGQ